MPHCCGSSGCQSVGSLGQTTTTPQRSTSSHLTLPQSGEDYSSSDTGQSRRSATRGISNRTCHRSTLLSSCPLSHLSCFFETKITLAGRCYSHISGIFASVLFIFGKTIILLLFFSMCYIVFVFCFFCLHAVVYKILAAELALHCSYAETLWSEVPLYVHPVY